MRAQSSVWIGIAEDDLEAAEHCMHGKQYLWSMFMCQQAVEKAIKAVFFNKTGLTPPKKHDLISLAGGADILAQCSKDTRDLLRRLSLYYIEARYPDKRAELEAKCTYENTKEILQRTKGGVAWLRSMLK
ncbi:HEPN domain protein [Desulforamulus reducens MI-1]|uniref:HEPN domain protein n=1 Tax=Desulforamulus reducens (strain ATCC BAA-1160 / DSM 100696 / MI-1) TaxID=349161 RepID=A4J8W2_DESRM|nr:HEPN domain-containing protein [Desulforamulus reducens]ABO51515.1 HEPN domain protein [Desulforamulus reducens MI-1]